jgi:hypothetical protein
MEKFKIEFKWASIFTAINILWVYAEKYLGLHDEQSFIHPIISYVLIVPITICIFFSLRQKRDDYYSGKITWQKAFLSGALFSLLIAGLSPGTIYVMTQYISPDFFNNAIQTSIEKGSDEKFVNEIFNLNSYIQSTMMLYLSFGVMISAIVGLVVKRNTAKTP